MDAAIANKENKMPIIAYFKCINKYTNMKGIAIYADQVCFKRIAHGFGGSTTLSHTIKNPTNKQCFFEAFHEYGYYDTDSLYFKRDEGLSILGEFFNTNKIYSLNDIYDIIKESWID